MLCTRVVAVLIDSVRHASQPQPQPQLRDVAALDSGSGKGFAHSTRSCERCLLRERGTGPVPVPRAGGVASSVSSRLRTGAPAASCLEALGCPRNRTKGTFRHGKTPLRTPSARTPASNATCTFPLGFCSEFKCDIGEGGCGDGSWDVQWPHGQCQRQHCRRKLVPS
mgnify:CR=1 FL=1